MKRLSPTDKDNGAKTKCLPLEGEGTGVLSPARRMVYMNIGWPALFAYLYDVQGTNRNTYHDRPLLNPLMVYSQHLSFVLHAEGCDIDVRAELRMRLAPKRYTG